MREPGNTNPNGGVRSSTRTRTGVVLPRRKCKQTECWFGKKVFDDSDHVEITFEDIIDVNTFAEEHSYMFVGTQLRKYKLGVPMGDPLSCAAALSCTLAAEMSADSTRQTRCGDADRNLSLCFMDDLFFKVAYESAKACAEQTRQGRDAWTKASARQYIAELMSCYPKPLELE